MDIENFEFQEESMVNSDVNNNISDTNIGPNVILSKRYLAKTSSILNYDKLTSDQLSSYSERLRGPQKRVGRSLVDKAAFDKTLIP